MESLMRTIYPAIEWFQDIAVLYEVKAETLPEEVQDGWLLLEKVINYAEAAIVDW